MNHVQFRHSHLGEMRKSICTQHEMHETHFRDFVQMMLCYAWSVRLLDYELWEDIPDISMAAAMHDIEKTSLPDEIINKKGRLSPEELEIVKAHSILGAAMVEIAIPNLKDTPLYQYSCEVCRHHHERVDGQGYPDHLRGEEIPDYVQIVSLADVYDALRTPRVYRKAVTDVEAVRMIRSGECGAFDSELLDAFEPFLGEFWELAHLAVEIGCNE